MSKPILVSKCYKMLFDVSDTYWTKEDDPMVS